MNLRIPAWAKGASVSVNGQPIDTEVIPGTFAAVHREWRDGDHIELNLPMTTRLESVDPQNPKTVALLFGPLVLFPMIDSFGPLVMSSIKPPLSASDLLAATRLDRRIWQVKTTAGPFRLLPFTDIGDEQYTTYLRIT